MMKIQLNTLILKKNLKNLFEAVNCSTVLPVLESVLIRVANKTVTYEVTDLESSLQYSHSIEQDGKCFFCINASSFLYFLTNSVEEMFEMNITDSKVKITSGSFSVSFKNDKREVEQFPIFPKMDKYTECSISYDTISTKLATALKFVSKDYLRPALTSVCLHTENGKLKIAATDAHSLYWEDVCEFADMPKILMPEKTVKLFLSNFKGKDISIKIEDTKISFSAEGILMICRRVDWKYPDYNVVIGRHDLIFYMKRKQFVSLLKLSAGYTNKSTYQVNLTVNETSMSANGGDMDFDMDFEYNLPIYNPSKKIEGWFAFGLNIKLMKRIVDCNKDEYIKIEHSTLPTKSIVIDDKFLLMPLMMNN